jgi:REP element-mobilizing transposase RayT
MSFIKVYIHIVWSTKKRTPYFDTPELREKVWKHILFNSRAKGIHVDFVSGYSDHCHCLISLKEDQTIQKVVQMIKGESSFWINKHKLTAEHFDWQDEYFVVSISESLIDRVRNYIKNQEQHHQKKTFQQEYQELLKKVGFQKFKD